MKIVDKKILSNIITIEIFKENNYRIQQLNIKKENGSTSA